MQLVIAESVIELELIIRKIKNFNSSYYILPFTLDTLVCCKKNKYKYFDPSNEINNEFHIEMLTSSNRLINSIKFGNIENDTLKKEYTNHVRKKFAQIYFSYHLISSILKKNKIENIYISGWLSSLNDIIKLNSNYSLTNIVKEYFSNSVNIIEVDPKKNNNSIDYCYEYSCSNFLSSKKKNILITSQGYNIYRFVLVGIFLNLKINIISEKEYNFLIKFILKILGVRFLKLKKKNKVPLKNFDIEDISFKHNGIDFSKLLNLSKETINLKLSDIYYKALSIEKILIKNNINLIISVLARGYQGYTIDLAKKYKITSLGITHGTISKNFNKNDEIYKKIIAEGVYSKNYDYFPVQTKIALDSLNTHDITNNKIITGNLIFAENLRKINLKKKILYAVTSKNFNQMQFLGTDLYFEFYKNLELLNDVSKKENFSVIVNLHPSVTDYSLTNLKILFKYLNFTKKNISDCLKDSFVTISFSSTVIEDSICSGVPVILFDRWKRYKHCNGEENISKYGQPIYYVKSINDLTTCIKNIKKNNKINLDDFKLGKNCFSNIYWLFKKIL